MAIKKNRILIMLGGILALVAAIWSGLLRAGLDVPAWHVLLPVHHGPMMICGFLGTLISLERAVAIKKGWMYAAPVLSGIGGILLIVGQGYTLAVILILLASGVLIGIVSFMLVEQPAMHSFVIASGALFWFMGNLLWLFGAPVYMVLPWWTGFLVLTIAGERLEINRLLNLTKSVRLLFFAGLIILMAGITVSPLEPTPGQRIAGIGLILLAAWLLSFDMVRKNIRREGLNRYTAVALFLGYLWLAAAGVLGALSDGFIAGMSYDAYVHALMLGFVFSMIFAHAPIVFPAILGTPYRFRAALYVPLALLHLSVLSRFVFALTQFPDGRLWSSIVNAAAILLFFAVFLTTVILSRRSAVTG